MKWTLTEDRLPKKEGHYLTYDKGDHYRILSNNASMKQYWERYVLYWMPLPAIDDGHIEHACHHHWHGMVNAEGRCVKYCAFCHYIDETPYDNWMVI